MRTQANATAAVSDVGALNRAMGAMRAQTVGAAWAERVDTLTNASSSGGVSALGAATTAAAREFGQQLAQVQGSGTRTAESVSAARALLAALEALQGVLLGEACQCH